MSDPRTSSPIAANALPPRPDPAHREQIDRLLLAFGSTTEPRAAHYVAGPITSGPRYRAWFAEAGRHLTPGTEEYRQARDEAVVRPNVRVGRAALQALRGEVSGTVIEPFSLDVPEWSQDDYRFFWGQVIERLVARIHLLPGWESSNGTAFECLVGLRAGVEVFDGKEPVTSFVAGDRLRNAVAELAAAGFDTEFLERVARELSAP